MKNNRFHRPLSRHSGLSSVLDMKLPVTTDPRYHDAVIFDLDGVLTDTACSGAAACAALLEPMVVLVRKLQGINVATAACSSNNYCRQTLKVVGIDDLFDVCIDGTVAGGPGLAGNGDPSLLLEATHRLGVRPQRAVVVEDADAGVIADRDGGFATPCRSRHSLSGARGTG